MKKSSLLSIIILVSNIVHSNNIKDFKANIYYINCNYAIANFSYSVDTAFADRVTCWDFGDGATSCNSYTNAANHNYSKPGSYTLTLKYIHNNDTTIVIKPDLITINNAPIADFTYYSNKDTLYFAPLTVYFSNKTTKGDGDSLKYKWDLGDNSTSSDENVIHTYTKPGTYDVALEVTDNLNCETNNMHTLIVKDTAQRDEFKFLKSACYESINVFPVPYDFGKKYEILNDTLKIRGIYSGNCGTTKTATIRYRGDTIVIKSWEVGPLATCGCMYYFEINIPHYAKDSAIVLFNGERIKSVIAAVPQVNKLDKSIRIYPNPVSDNFRLETDDNSTFPLTMIIKDIDGRKMHENTVNSSNTNVNTSNLKAGIYVLYLYSKQGFATKKIIKI